MTRLLLIFLCALIGCLADPDPVCSDNETLNSCLVDCVTDFCPRSEEEALQGCPPTPDPCPPSACKCRFNYRYVSPENTTCIPTRECPPFECNRPFEEFNPCPPYCPTDSCSQATPDGTCPKSFGHILVVLKCSPKCRCIKNYWRQDGVCIPYAECPQNLAPAANATEEASIPETSAPASPTSDTQGDPDNSSPQSGVTNTEYTLPSAQVVAGSSEESQNQAATAEASAGTSTPDNQTPADQKDLKNIPQTQNEVTSAETVAEDCKSIKETCNGPNEEYVLKKQTCPPEFCYAITARINCTDAPPPQPGCACKPGYYRVNATRPCVHMCDCPQVAYTPDCLGIVVL